MILATPEKTECRGRGMEVGNQENIIVIWIRVEESEIIVNAMRSWDSWHALGIQMYRMWGKTRIKDKSTNYSPRGCSMIETLLIEM